MSLVESIAPPLRLPLACFLASFLLAGIAVSLSVNAAAAAETLKRQSQHDRLARTKELEHRQRMAGEVSDGLALLAKIKAETRPESLATHTSQGFPETAKIDIATATSREKDLWIIQTLRLSVEIPHEDHLLDMLRNWRDQSPGLHLIRACRIERLAHALQADCQLESLTLAGRPAQ